LSPFGSISPAAKPRWPVIGPTFWVCRAKSGAAFRRAKRPGAVCPLRGHGFATPHRSFAVPVTAAPRRVPNGKTPALAPHRLHFARGETARQVTGPTGAVISALLPGTIVNRPGFLYNKRQDSYHT